MYRRKAKLWEKGVFPYVFFFWFVFFHLTAVFRIICQILTALNAIHISDFVYSGMHTFLVVHSHYVPDGRYYQQASALDVLD